MSERLFTITNVSKSAQGNKKTKFDSDKLYTGSHSAAAKKAMYHTCRKMGKKIKGRCTLTMTVMEVIRKTIDGVPLVLPKIDSDGKKIVRKYKVKLTLNKDSDVVYFEGLNEPISFKYTTEIVKSYGRI